MESFDLAVIGAGPGGYPAAIKAAQKGLTVCLIDKEPGGTCLHRGCIPSKALISAARLFARTKEAKQFGIEVESLHLDFSKMVLRSQAVVQKMAKSLEGLIKAHGVTLVKGFATLLSKEEIALSSGETIRAKNILIATGSKPRELSLFSVDGKRIHDSTSLLQLKELPKRLVVIGGGVIGSEFASLFCNLGSTVSIVELLPRLISTESEKLSETLKRAFEKRGIQLFLGNGVKEMKRKEEEIELTLQSGETVTSDHLLVSVGREVDTKGLGLESASVKVDSRGFITVSEQMETSTRGIYAIGDVTGKSWLAHAATKQGAVAIASILKEPVSFQETIPSVIFTDPEMASVGLTKEEGLAVGEFPFLALGKAEAEGHTEGFARLFADPKTGQIVGAEVAGEGASTLIGEMALAVANELTLECVAEVVHAHPTLSEAWMEAAFIALGTPMHLPPRRKR